MSAKKATEMIRYYKNPNGPTIGVTAKDVIESDGLYFKDLNGDGTLNTYKDWRKTPSERAKALAEELSSEEKIGLLFICLLYTSQPLSLLFHPGFLLLPFYFSFL